MIRFQALWKTKSFVKVCLKFKLPLWTKGLLIHLSPLWQLPLWHFPRWHNFPVMSRESHSCVKRVTFSTGYCNKQKIMYCASVRFLILQNLFFVSLVKLSTKSHLNQVMFKTCICSLSWESHQINHDINKYIGCMTHIFVLNHAYTIPHPGFFFFFFKKVEIFISLKVYTYVVTACFRVRAFFS